MPRHLLSDKLWPTLRAMMREQGIYDKPNLRSTVEGILYRLRVGCPWRDVPESFGHWNSIYKQFNHWSSKGKLMKVFKGLVQEPDMEWVFVDGSIVKAHQHSAGALGEQAQAIGKSRGGLSTKIHLATDAYGLPIEFDLSGGEVHDSKAAPELLAKVPEAQSVIADKGYDSETLRKQIRDQGAIPIIPRKRNSKKANPDMDWHLYRYRHLVENAFARLKHFRAIATRYDKLERNYQGMIALACAFLWLPM